MLSHQTLKVVADAVNPSLGILAIVLPFAKSREAWRQAAAHLGVTLVIVALTYLFRAGLQLEALWASWGMDFSTHGAICIVLVVALSSLAWKRFWVWGVIFVSYDALMVYQSYHTWADIGTTSAVVLPFTLALRYWGDRWGASMAQAARATSS